MRKRLVFLTGLSLLAFAASAGAQGFSVYEHSACATARGGAGVAQPCADGSSIFYNPAAMVFQKGVQIGLGSTFINPRGDFTNTLTNTVGTLQNHYYPVPSAYVTKAWDKVAIGAGLFAPYGLTTDWPTTFEGRFLGYKTTVKGIYIQPTVAYKLGSKVSIGAGLDVAYASLELNQRVDLSSQFLLAPGQHPLYPNGLRFFDLGVPLGTDFANVQLSGHGWKVGYHLGFLAKVTDRITFGGRYLSRQRFSIDNGTVATAQIQTGTKLPVAIPGLAPAGTSFDTIVQSQFSAPNSLADGQTATTSIIFPDAVVFGVAIKAAAKTTVFADYQWTGWALFDQLVITKQYPTTPAGANVITLTENFKNTHGVRLGVEHELNAKTILRAGFIKHTAAAPDETVTPLLPEGPRTLVSGGLGYRLSKFLTADVYYMYLKQSDRAGRTVPGKAADNNGTYSFMSHLFGISFSAGF